MSASDLFGMLVNPLLGPSPLHQKQSSIMALGHCNPDCYETLAKNLKGMYEIPKDQTTSKQKTKIKAEEVNYGTWNPLNDGIVKIEFVLSLLSDWYQPTMTKRFELTCVA